MALQESGILKKLFERTLNAPRFIPLEKYKIEQPIGNDKTEQIYVIFIHLWPAGFA